LSGALIPLALVLLMSSWVGALRINAPYEKLSWLEIQPVPAKPVMRVALEEGQTPPLLVFTPVLGNQCGNSPLPCTPHVTGQRLRVPGDLSKGFLANNEFR
jgi:hypothetical protein